MRLSNHATVVAYLALFVALGGTAYAATGGNIALGQSNRAGQTTSLKNTGSGPALKLSTDKATTAPLAVSNDTKISNLNADELDGLGSGAFGRRPTLISADTTSPNPDSAGSIGPWSFALECISGLTQLDVTGPGRVGGLISRSTGLDAASTGVLKLTAIGDRFSAGDNTDQHSYLALFLESGSKVAEVHLLMADANDGGPELCSVTGSAVLVG